MNRTYRLRLSGQYFITFCICHCYDIAVRNNCCCCFYACNRLISNLISKVQGRRKCATQIWQKCLNFWQLEFSSVMIRNEGCRQVLKVLLAPLYYSYTLVSPDTSPCLQSTEKLLNALNTSAKIKRLHADDFMTYEATNSHFARIFKYKKSKNIL